MASQSLASIRAKVHTFLQLDTPQRIACISDDDEDGMTAGVQAAAYLKSLGHTVQVFYHNHSLPKVSFAKEFVQFAPQVTLFTDIGEGLVSKILIDLGPHTGKFVIIDHHQPEPLQNNEYDYVVVKPTDFSDILPSRYPASKMVFDVLEGTDWLAAIGIIGDFAFEAWGPFLNAVEKKNKVSYTQLKAASDTIGCIITEHQELTNELGQFVAQCKSINDLLSSKYYTMKVAFDKVLAAEVARFRKEAEEYPELDLFIFETKPGLGNRISNLTSVLHPNKTVLILAKKDGLVKGSFRRQDFKVNCAELAKYATKDIPGANGGGHIPAAGSGVPPQYFEEYKKRVFDFLKKNNPTK